MSLRGRVRVSYAIRSGAQLRHGRCFLTFQLVRCVHLIALASSQSLRNDAEDEDENHCL